MSVRGLSPTRPWAVTRRSALLGLAALGWSPALLCPVSAVEPAGRVRSAEGRSTALLDGALRDLQTEAEVFLQELVQTGTGARLGLALGVQTRVNLGERTRLKIEKSLVDQGGELLLERGALLFDRPEGKNRGEPIVRTPFAIVAARGTRFFVGPSKGVIGVFVERGEVSVRNNAGAVILEAGEGTDLTSPDVPPTRPAPWGRARIEAALATVT